MTTTVRTEAKPKSPASIQSALRTLASEQAGLVALTEALSGALAASFGETVRLISSARGRVVVTGVGKSGHVGRKIASTLASTGTPAFFVHAAEAGHGDLGMFAGDDVVIALSWSGESAELRNVLEYSRRFQIPLVAVTAEPGSALGRAADIVLALPKVAEACPHGLAPTTSTIMQLALGDALAIALLEGRGFTAEDFRVFHPGGKLGASLHFVRDIMHRGDAVPLVPLGTPMSEAILVISAKSFGCVGITGRDGRLAGVITDGDLRRHMSPDLLGLPVDRIMTASPKSIGPDVLVGEALAMMNLHQHPFTVLFVVEDERPVGLVHMHDLLRIGVA